jgi:hypothetical protein
VEKRLLKKNVKKRSNSKKKKKSIIIAVKKDISLKSIDYLKLITRKPTILRKNENEKFKKSLN